MEMLSCSTTSARRRNRGVMPPILSRAGAPSQISTARLHDRPGIRHDGRQSDKSDEGSVMATSTAPPRSAPALPAPPATRLRRPSWRDPRLVVGLLLVAVSVAAGSWVVTSAQAATPVWVARGTLTPGTQLSTEHLVAADVRLGSEQ